MKKSAAILPPLVGSVSTQRKFPAKYTQRHELKSLTNRANSNEMRGLCVGAPSMEAAMDSVKQFGVEVCFGLYSGVMSKQYFAFLRRLQAGGRSNMYGAVPYLMRAFGLDRERAFGVVCQWIDWQAEAAGRPAPVQERHAVRTVAARVKRKKRSRVKA